MIRDKPIARKNNPTPCIKSIFSLKKMLLKIAEENIVGKQVNNCTFKV